MARKSRKNVAVPEAPKEPAMKVWQAALYIRLSVEFNGKRGDSLETQRQIMEAYTALCPDIEVVGVYTDNGTTGRTFEREAFQRMLADVESGKIDCIVVKDLSRLGRNTIDTGYYIEKYFPLHGVRFIAVNDQFDSESGENSGNHLIVPLKNMINEAYAADISKKVRAQQNQAMRDGEFVGARPPYGYRKDPDNCHRLLVNEDTAPVVRQIFQWTLEGVALNVIVKRLNEGGVTPIDGLPEYEAWVSSGAVLSGDALRPLAEKAPGTIFARVLHWNDLVNAKISTVALADKRPFPGAAQGLEAASGFADIAVISTANRAALLEEWGEYGLLGYADVILAQDSGSKPHCIGELLKKGYAPDHVLMVGDAPGDYEAAKANGVCFYPMLCRREAESWAGLQGQGFEAFKSASYPAYGARMLDAFFQNLGTAQV